MDCKDSGRAFADAQTELSLCWAQTPLDWFSYDLAHMFQILSLGLTAKLSSKYFT